MIIMIPCSGYVPPEYIEKGKISDKFDVFSLGVIIIGIITGPDGYSKHSEMSSQDIAEQVRKVICLYEDLYGHFF